MEIPGEFDGNAIHCTLALLRLLTGISCAFQVIMLMVNPVSSISVAYIWRRECCSLKDQPMRPTKTLGGSVKGREKGIRMWIWLRSLRMRQDTDAVRKIPV